jgi:hypothetical protein
MPAVGSNGRESACRAARRRPSASERCRGCSRRRSAPSRAPGWRPRRQAYLRAPTGLQPRRPPALWVRPQRLMLAANPKRETWRPTLDVRYPALPESFGAGDLPASTLRHPRAPRRTPVAPSPWQKRPLQRRRPADRLPGACWTQSAAHARSRRRSRQRGSKRNDKLGRARSRKRAAPLRRIFLVE